MKEKLGSSADELKQAVYAGYTSERAKEALTGSHKNLGMMCPNMRVWLQEQLPLVSSRTPPRPLQLSS